MDILLIKQSIHNSAEISFSRSGGPGGQNVNKLNTKVTMRLTLSLLEGLSDAERHRLRETLGSRLSHVHAASGNEELVISSSEERSQRINLERAFARAEALIIASARLPKKRKPTKPTAAARENRLKIKRIRSEKKTNRRFTEED